MSRELIEKALAEAERMYCPHPSTTAEICAALRLALKLDDALREIDMTIHILPSEKEQLSGITDHPDECPGCIARKALEEE